MCLIQSNIDLLCYCYEWCLWRNGGFVGGFFLHFFLCVLLRLHLAGKFVKVCLPLCSVFSSRFIVTFKQLLEVKLMRHHSTSQGHPDDP